MAKESIYIKSTKCEEVDRIPIWLMRQAGRSMKVYRDLREKYSMMQILKTPELACEVTLQPIKAFGMDAAIIFSDILVIPDALGLGLEFHDSQGPLITRPIRTQADVNQLDISLVPGCAHYVMEAIKMVKEELRLKRIPLIGFAGSPFTLASYVMGGRQDLKAFIPIVFNNIQMMHSLLDQLTLATVRYLNAQIQAGVDAIQIFDSWSNVLSWSSFQELSLPYLHKVISQLVNPHQIPITVFGTSYSNFYPLLQEIGANVISLDSRVDIGIARKMIRPDIALQGNLDPYFLLAPKDILKQQALSILTSMKGSKGFIFNLGHGVLPGVQEDHIKLLVDLVQHFPIKG
jgi:uroporphyrinogen decarboxylase